MSAGDIALLLQKLEILRRGQEAAQSRVEAAEARIAALEDAATKPRKK
jgi:hypothetical protein